MLREINLEFSVDEGLIADLDFYKATPYGFLTEATEGGAHPEEETYPKGNGAINPAEHVQ